MVGGVTRQPEAGLSLLTKLYLRSLLGITLRRDAAHIGAISGLATMPGDRVKIGAVQWNAEPVSHVEEWSTRIRRLFEQAADAHCHLLVFPEYLPISLLGAIMPSSQTVSTLTDAAIRSVLRSLGPVTFRHWQRWMSAYSQRFSMVTVAGSGLTLYQGTLINVVLGFDATGSQCLWQPKWHPLDAEARWGVAQGPTVQPDVANPWGLSALVCNDATYFESFRMLQSRGARIVAVPIADPEARYSVGKARRGCFSRVQDVPMVGVVAASTGRLFGLRLTGKAGIYLPSALTPDGSGILVESPQPVGEGLVSAVVSLNQVEQFQRDHEAAFPVPSGHFVQALYQFEEDY